MTEPDAMCHHAYECENCGAAIVAYLEPPSRWCSDTCFDEAELAKESSDE